MSINKLSKSLAFQLLEEQGEKPQFEADHLSKVQEILDERGVLYTVEQVPANELTVIQADGLSEKLVNEKADRIKKEEEVKPVVVSEEYDIIDGRHEVRAIGEVKNENHKLPVVRVHLPSSEATGMLNDIQRQITEDQKDMTVVAVFSGRFQPFHRGHYQVYEHLRNRFGRNNTYIGTSNKVDPPRSPFTFDQKKKIITSLFDVPHENVVEVKNPYGPKEILDQYDENTTAYVSAVSEKDKGRLLGSGYFNEYPPEDGELIGYRDGGYVYTTPMAGFTFRGDEISGTRVREAFRTDDIPEQEKKDFFKYIYGTFNQEVYDLMTKRLTESNDFNGKLIEAFLIERGIGRAVKTAKRKLSYKLIKEGSTVKKISGVDDGPTTWYERLEDYQEQTDAQAQVLGYEVLDYITDHMDDSLKQSGLPFDSFYPTGMGPTGAVENPREIYEPFAEAVAEAAGYELLSWMGTLDEDDIMSLHHDDTDNIAIAFGNAEAGTDPSNSGDEQEVGKSIQDRLEDFGGNNNMQDLNDPINEIVQSVKKNLLKEGGGHGHMNHPFEDLDLTFGDLKNMINLAFDGNLDIEEEPVEKVDGQNLMISWKDGDLCAARNKGHIKNFGEGAMDLRDLIDKFEGRGAIREAFEYAFRDLAIALSEVRNDKLQEMFENGRKWMSLEVIYPAAKNVMDYGDSFIVFHGVIEHDKNGNAVDFKKDAAYRLAELVEKVDQKVQEEFEIVSPPEVDLPNIQLEDLRSELVGEVEDYMAEYGMSNDNKVMDWHEEWWEEFIREKAEEYDYDIPEHVVAGLIKRWAWGNKSGEDGYGLRTFKSQVEDEDFKSWADAFDKNDYKEQFKENIKPIEEVFLRLGTEVLKRIETVLAVDPEHTEEDIKQQLQDVRQELDGAPADESSVQTLQQQMDRLKNAGGIDDIALEGIVFQYDGKTYKLTGSWAPLNQIVGIMKYGR